MNTSKDKEINQVQEETKEGMVVARGTPCNHGVDSVALRGQRENQLVARSTDDGVSPVEGSCADMDDSASSSMESNDTYGSMVPVLLRGTQARIGCGPRRRYATGKHASLWFPRTVEAAYGQQEGGSADGSE